MITEQIRGVVKTRKCEIFAKLLTIVAKLSILDTCWGPDYASAVD